MKVGLDIIPGQHRHCVGEEGGGAPQGHNVTEAGNLLQILGVAKILGGGKGGGMADNVIYSNWFPRKLEI